MAHDASRALTSSSEGDRWVGIRRACEILGVNQSTLRIWTDSGRVPAFLTPGGHRRYREADLRALTEPRAGVPAPLAEILLASHECYEAVARGAFRSSPWFRDLDESARHHFRLLGTSMLQLLGAHIIADGRRERERSLARGREVAAEYGQVAAGLGLSLPEATEAFVLFRNPVLDLVYEWLGAQARPSPKAGETLKRLNHFMDQVLLSMASEHERASERRRPGEVRP